MKTVAEHKGTVLFVDGNRIDVEMTVHSACSACKASKACGMGESKDKIISLHTESAKYYTEGEEVSVSIEQRMGMKAAAYAYIFPFFIVLAVLLGMLETGFSEDLAGLSALGAAAVYFVVLAFFRRKIEKEFLFKLSKIES
jgi:sigma-E factor negative regulatory protein RseC